ncbi:MAG: dipeptidase [Cellulosilyticaceae bacterium]
MSFIDFHCDTASRIYYDRTKLYDNSYHIDITKLRQSNYLAQWFAFFVNTASIGEKSPMEEFQEMYNYFIAEVNNNPKDITVVTNYESYIKAKKEKKIGAFLSLEEGQVLEGDLSNVDKLEDLGIRLMTLTWNFTNSLGHPHTINEGLTDLGKELAKYLNSKKILVDIAHLSKEGMKDIIALYKKPIIASHSNAQGFYNHTRNLDDTTIKAIANSGGVVGVNFYSYFLNHSRHTKIEDLVGVINYLYQVGGEDILALGTDFDGIDCDLEVCNCAEMDKLISSLSRLYSNKVIEKFSYGNIERVIKETL